MTVPALETRNLHVAFNGPAVLCDVSITIPTGAVVTILGPNGAGKTTLLRTLAGLIKPTSGEVLVNGSPLSSLTPRDLATRIAYVPQMTEKTMPCRVADFVLLSRYAHGRHLFGSADAADHEAACRAMQRAGIEAFAERDLSTLSGGERQKVLVAAALAQEASILLLDEPAAFLDYRRQLELAELLDGFRHEGPAGSAPRTVVSVVHDLNGGALESDLVIGLADGRLAFAQPPADLIDTGRLADLYGVEFDLVQHQGSGRRLIFPLRPRHP